MTLGQYTREFNAMYEVRTGMKEFAEGGGEEREIGEYQQRGLSPYEAVSREIDRYGMVDLGENEEEDYETARSRSLI